MTPSATPVPVSGQKRTEELKCEVDWKAALAAWNDWKSGGWKDASKAKRITDLIPNPVKDTWQCPGQRDFVDAVGDNTDFFKTAPVLLSQGRLEILDFAFAAMRISDGHFAEELSNLIASILDSKPGEVLARLQKEGGSTYCFDSIIHAGGPIDDPVGEGEFLKKRKASLQSVTDPKLKDVRDTCLKVLSRFESVFD